MCIFFLPKYIKYIFPQHQIAMLSIMLWSQTAPVGASDTQNSNVSKSNDLDSSINLFQKANAPPCLITTNRFLNLMKRCLIYINLHENILTYIEKKAQLMW